MTIPSTTRHPYWYFILVLGPLTNSGLDSKHTALTDEQCTRFVKESGATPAIVTSMGRMPW